MKTALAFAFALLLAGCASTPMPTATSPSVEWRYAGSTSYEARTPGLGSSRRYASSAGWIDVYVYGLRRSDWLPGVDDPRFGAHFESTIDEVRLFEKRGVYRNVRIGATRDVALAETTYRTVSFRYAVNGEPIVSATYLTASKGRLVKYRISLYLASGLDLDTEARAFIAGNTQAAADMLDRKPDPEPGSRL